MELLTRMRFAIQSAIDDGGTAHDIEKAIKHIIELHEANKPHLVTQDAMTNCVHVLPVDFIKDLSNSTQNLKHLPEKEMDAIVRCIANAVVELCNPTPNLVGYVKTVGGYPDESEHKVEWVVKHKELKDGQPLYTTPPTREPLSEDVIVDAYENSGYKQTLRPQDRFAVMSFARAIEQAHGIGATSDQPQAIPTR